MVKAKPRIANEVVGGSQPAGRCYGQSSGRVTAADPDYR
jgi:hypothetical protein